MPLPPFSFGLFTVAHAQDRHGLNVGTEYDITLVVICSQYPELDADYVRRFLETRSGQKPPALIVDGFDAAPKTLLDDPQAKKALLFAAGRQPDQKVMNCVRSGVSFDQLVFDLASKGWGEVGLRPDDPKHPMHDLPNPLLRYYAPTNAVISFRYVADGNWTVATTASAQPFSKQIDSTLETWFNLDPR